MRFFLSLAFVITLSPAAFAQEPCQDIHGRARLYIADGKLRIWQIGTKHEFEPADKTSWDKVARYLDNGGSPANQPSLYADFTLCPTQPYKAGSVQRATVKDIQHARVVPSQPAK